MSGADADQLAPLFEDYATAPVPADKCVSGLRIGLVLGGIGIALPALLAGAQIGSALGLAKAATAFMTAGLFLTALGWVAGLVGSGTRLSTYMIIQFPFGSSGAKIVNLSFAVAQFGWFGVNVYLFGTAAEAAGRSVFPDLGSGAYILFGGVLMTVSTIFGFKALDKLGMIAVPLLIATLAVMISRALGLAPLDELLAQPGTGDMTFSVAISALAGGIMVGVVLLPDLTRYSRSSLHTLIAILIPLAIIEPLVHLAAAMPAIATGLRDVLPILLAVGFGGYALVVLIFSSWTTNAVNLYGSGLALSAIFPRAREWQFVVLSGVLGTAIAFFDIPELFITFLYYQALIFTPVVGIYVADYFVVSRRRYELAALPGRAAVNPPAFVAWIAGSALAYVTGEGYVTLSGIPALDAAIASAGLYLALMALTGRGRHENRG